MQRSGEPAENSFRRGIAFRIATPASYRIRVVGEVDETSLERLMGLKISTSGQGKKPITTLTGWFPDQTALFDVLKALYDLRLPLLSVVHLEDT